MPRFYRYQMIDFLYKEVILIQDKRWFQCIPNLKSLIYRIYTIQPFTEQTTLCFSNNHIIQKLNYQFRKKNKPTNVLTFENLNFHSYGGDIIFAFETIQKEANRNQKPLTHHLAHLIIHGLLHLQNYDHVDCNEAKTMEMKEAFLLNKLGISNPWKNSSFRSI